MKTKEQYLDDLNRGPERALLNEVVAETKALFEAAEELYDNPVLKIVFPESMAIAFAYVGGAMAQKKESQKVISTLVDLCAQFSDLFTEIEPQLNDEQVKKFETLMQNFIDCKLDYIPFKGE